MLSITQSWFLLAGLILLNVGVWGRLIQLVVIEERTHRVARMNYKRIGETK